MTDHLHRHDHEHHDHSHQRPLRDWLKTALLIGLGLYFVFIIASGSLSNYVNIRFAWLSYVAAALFLLLGLASLLKLRQQAAHAHHHDHDHTGISWPMLAIIALPLILGTLIPSRPLGAAAVDGDFSLSSASGDSASAYSIAPEDRNILDWLRAFNVAEDLERFSGQPVDLIGFVYHSDDFSPGQFMVARFTISCCVADSSAVGLPVAWNEPLAADTWVQIRGQFQMGDFQGETRPIIQADTIEIIPQPDHPYLYP
jgi:uncharacterized repeat protein (TIGR03943 family)